MRSAGYVVGSFVAILCGCLLVGCARERPARAGDRLVVGICDPLCRETASACVRASARRTYGAFAVALGEQTGLEVVLRYYKFDGQLAAAIASGKVDAAIGKTWTILRAAEASGRAFERLADLPRPDGVNELCGVFIARDDSALERLDGLTGKTVALGPEAAYEKSHAARRALDEARVKPGEIRVLDGCIPVAAAVFEREVDAGVVSSYVVDFGGLALVADASNFRVIGRTRGVPFMTFALSTTTAAPKKKLRDALLEMSGARLPEGLLTTGFAPPRAWSPPEVEGK